MRYHFTNTIGTIIWTQATLRRRLHLPKDDERDLEPILRDSTTRLARLFDSARLELEPTGYRRFPIVRVRLDPSRAWDALQKEIESLQQDDIGAAKADRQEPTTPQLPPPAGAVPSPQLANNPPWNAVWKGSIERFGKADLDGFRDALFQHAIEQQPKGAGALLLYSLQTVAQVQHCFPSWRQGHYETGGLLAAFLKAVRLPPCVALSFDLSQKTQQWWIALVPKPDWESALRAICEEESRPTTEQRLGLSADAARLYEWIEALRPSDYLGAWTPVVEDLIESEIGITAKWPSDNFPALIQMLSDEISAKTQYQLTLQPWNALGHVKTRLKVVKKAPQAEALSGILTAWVRDKGVVPTAEQLHAALNAVAANPANKPPA